MKILRPALYVIALVLLYGNIVHAQGLQTISDPLSKAKDLEASNFSTISKSSEPERTLLLIADNQEHLLTGVPLKSMGPKSEKWITSVALRSPLANVGGRLLFEEALRFGKKEGADLVLHLGDAADISCPDELSAVFDILDKEAPNIWFMTPGNHDGLLAGSFADYQPSFGFDVSKHPSVYEKTSPLAGHKNEKRGWLNACLSPTNSKDPSRANILTKGDAIRQYVDRIKKRPEAQSKESKTGQIFIKGERGPDIPVKCAVEEIEIKSLGYLAKARICERTRVPGKTTWVGPYASFIIQKFVAGDTTFVLVDTSYYENPEVKNVALHGELSSEQRRDLEEFFKSTEREKVIVAGHHPLDDLKKIDQTWIMEKSSRYMSAHVHRSTQLIDHNNDKFKLKELNIGSTLDYPPQAVVAKINPTSVRFKVAGADTSKTQWVGFLEQCETHRKRWKFEDKFYQNYTRDTYVSHLIKTLQTAAARHNNTVASTNLALEIPIGNRPGDWLLLDKTLQSIRASEGESRTFWGCQAYYASEATRQEASVWEKWSKKLGLSTKSGSPATGDWFDF